jgi:hypothetical protein
MKSLAVRYILRIHERVIETSGGDPTILDLGKIDSAVAQPRMTFEALPGHPLRPGSHLRAFSRKIFRSTPSGRPSPWVERPA